MHEWKKTKLGEIVKLSTGAAFKGNLYEFSGSYRVVRGENITEGFLRWDSQKFWNYQFDEKYLLNENDIVIGMDGSKVGKNKARIKSADLPLIIAQRVARIKANELSNQDFVWYLVISKRFLQYIESIYTGTSIPHISLKQIADFDVLVPPLEEQKAIAEVLSSLDDKIDLLHRQNKTLEELAQTLFRQWFIEEAKDEWEEYEVRDFATHKKVSIKPAQNPNDEFLHFSLPAFDTNKEPNIELGSDIKSNKYQVEPFSILMSKLNPKTPRVWDIYFEPKVNSICSTEFQVIQPNEKEFFPFISTLLKSDKVIGDLTMSASGTSGSHQRVKPEDILNINFLTPSVDKIKKFSELLEPNYLKTVQNQKQIKSLENMRDTLLPKLMSGEVKVNY